MAEKQPHRKFSPQKIGEGRSTNDVQNGKMRRTKRS
jgi:hypothetical protein